MKQLMHSLFHTPLFGLGLTMLAYFGSMALHQRVKWLPPMIVSIGGILLFLLLTDIPYASYQLGGDLIVFFLGPATVALAVPLYKYYLVIREKFYPIMLGIFLGTLLGMLSAGVLVLLAGGTHELMLTMIPKTATTPIAIEVSGALGGVPQLTAVMVVLTGLLGSIMGKRFLSWFGITSDIAIGVAMGTSSHGVGTARLLQESEVQGSVSGFAMGMTGVLVAILAVPLHFFM